jgi:nucleotide-binding universal stress UspA family protein
MSGTNAYRVVSDSDIPVLSIRNSSKNYGFKKILVPFSDQPHSREKVKYAIRMAEINKAELLLYGVDIEKSQQHRERIQAEAQQIKQISESHGVPCTIRVVSEGYFAKQMLDHARQNGADLIVEMSGMDRESLTEYFMEPFAEYLINHSPIPVMSVQPLFNTDTIDLRFYWD